MILRDSGSPCRATPSSGLFAHRVERIIPRVFSTSYRFRIQLPLSLSMHAAVQTGSAELERALSLRVIECTAEPVSSVHTTLRSSPRRVSQWSVMVHVSFIFYMDCLQEQTLFCFSKAFEVLELLNKTARDNKSITRYLSVLVAAAMLG